MTSQEAIEVLKGDFSKVTLCENESHSDVFAKAFRMAIEALERAAGENDNDVYEQRRQKCIEARQDFYCGTSVTDIIEVVKEKFCINFCKYADECQAKLEAGEDLRPCPLDRL